VESVESLETDVLGEPYQLRRIPLPADDEGELVASLVIRRAPAPTRRAVLYVHGYVDYFFQTHLADFYVERGYDFYALDLRRYGRSLRPYQTPNFTTDLREYFTEIDEAVRIIREEDGHDTLLVNGHSTGGLIAALWAHHLRGRGVVQGLFLNSPFFEFAEPWVTRKILTPLVSLTGKRTPKRRLPQQLTSTYGLSIHSSQHGEWNYSLDWKPLTGFGVFAGWVRAISQAHRRLQSGLDIDVPVLVACSTKSYRGPYTPAAQDADAVLNVDHIVRYAAGLGRDVTVVRIEGGKHDLTLSAAPARERLFTALDGWLGANLGVDAR
jgi:alpha-beta hydrolase superfamily lysophospholipase